MVTSRKALNLVTDHIVGVEDVVAFCGFKGYVGNHSVVQEIKIIPVSYNIPVQTIADKPY